jgi:hypothetical protein
MLKNTLQNKNKKCFLLKDNLIVNLNIMPELSITKKFIYLHKRSNHQNDDP